MKNNRPIKVGQVREINEESLEYLHKSLYYVLRLDFPEEDLREDLVLVECLFLSGEQKGIKEWFDEKDLQQDIVVM